MVTSTGPTAWTGFQPAHVQSSTVASGTGAQGGTAAVAGASNIKYDAPKEYDGTATPGVRVWLTQVERYMRLVRMPDSDRFDFVATKCLKSASSWMDARLQAIDRGDRAVWASW